MGRENEKREKENEKALKVERTLRLGEKKDGLVHDEEPSDFKNKLLQRPSQNNKTSF